MPTWPGSLPQFVLEQGFNKTMADQTAETQMDAGPAKIRRRFTTNTTRYQVSLAMSPAQLDTFETFYYSTLQGGSLSFDWVEPVTRVAKTFRFRKPAPSQRAIMTGNVTIVSFTMECLN